MIIIIISVSCHKVNHLNESSGDYLQFDSYTGSFPIASNGKATPIYFDKNEFPGVKKIAKLFQKDILEVTGANADIIDVIPENIDKVIIIGTLGKNTLIDELIKSKRLDVSDITDKWETSLIHVVDQPFDNIQKALIIAGSDKRGTIYGMFDISRKMGVSPWYWWADVPIDKHEEVYIKSGRYNLGEPKVKYRGIFLNDEEPALGRWAVANYGGFTHEFYEKVFELILRLKGNYLWPAMWWASFNSNDSLNQPLADELGIVMGTSHHEPMIRAHAEWRKDGKGDWNYDTNPDELKKFWQQGIQRMNNYESIVTIGMRGDGDVAMSEEANIELLEKIVKDQRQIIENITEQDAKYIPQLWALYKEVQEYYNNGMKVPDDVTLLLCDDNWGNIRKLPDINTPPREGGYGMYYHFDFVGGPRSYKWLNVSHLSRVWEQMNLCYNYGVDKIWLVNVGDLKPMELPVSFFLDFAWDPDQWPASRLRNYHLKWAEEQFGEEYSEEIAELLWFYTKYNRRRTPEMLNDTTYSLVNYREFERVTDEYDEIFRKSDAIYNDIDTIYKDSYFQLVHHPVWACSNLYKMYFAQAKNQLYEKQGRAATNLMAVEVKTRFLEDEKITQYYHEEVTNGKWNRMMAQTHIGYTSWQQPQTNILPGTKSISIPDEPQMGVTYLGTHEYWTSNNTDIILPLFDSYNKQSNIIEIFNKGKRSFRYTIKTDCPWIILSKDKGNIDLQDTIGIKIDWNSISFGQHIDEISIISENNENVKIKVQAIKYNEDEEKPKGFIERDGYVSMEASNYDKATSKNGVTWNIIPGLSRTGSGITTIPVTEYFSPDDKELPELVYFFHLLNKPKYDSVTVHLNVAPTHNLTGNGLFYAIAIDNEKPQIIDIHKNNIIPDWEYPDWFNTAVGNYSIRITSRHKVTEEGKHVLKLFMISSGVVFQKIVIDNGMLKSSYLGPPESIKK
ncbi:MAG: glycosyl hydrolase 115 family protein [Bacteroidales bacterium]|nr:glycosyl hydrolase 115 family protein [Bacteroidales bacterium]